MQVLEKHRSERHNLQLEQGFRWLLPCRQGMRLLGYEIPTHTLSVGLLKLNDVSVAGHHCYGRREVNMNQFRCCR